MDYVTPTEIVQIGDRKKLTWILSFCNFYVDKRSRVMFQNNNYHREISDGTKNKQFCSNIRQNPFFFFFF